MEEEIPILVPCSICGRTFKPESLEKHYKACERNRTKKRKVFDSTIQRIQGTDLAEFLPKILNNKINERKSPRDKPEKVIENNKPEKVIENNKTEKVIENNRPERKKTPDLAVKTKAVINNKLHDSMQCPYCDRSFCAKAFERHVEWCKDRRAPVTPPPNILKAKEMLDARLKYSAPKHCKNKKMQSCEKPGTQSDIHKEKNITYHSVNQFGVEKISDKVRCNTQMPRAKGSLSAPSCNLSKRCSSEARLTELSSQCTSNFEQSSNLNNARGSYSDISRQIKTENNMVQLSANACNNITCDTSTTEGQMSPKGSDNSMENQEYYSAENVAPDSGRQDNGLSTTQSCYTTDLIHNIDCYSESLPSVLDEKISLSVWSSRQSVTTSVSGMKRAKFCHECGSKYPVEMAKYCCECGEQRLIIKNFSRSNI